jgi:hypothetical protein
MKSSTIHHLNSLLIILSCVVAFYIPFELFLFSYGILGPLHYLTEIGWLHKKNYFTKGKYDFLILVGACVLLVYWNYNPPKNYGLMADIVFVSLLCSIAFVFMKDWLYRFVLLALVLVFVGFVNNAPQFYVWAGIFLPTIIHVFIFTWAFMLYGVLKEKSIPGTISIFALIICSVLLLVIKPENSTFAVSAFVQNSYARFADLNFNLINLFNLDKLTEVKQIFTTSAGLVIMRFIAFAYTYHYLNWFSKTSVIKWHLVPKRYLFITLLLWVISASLYVYDYNLGIHALILLSFLHVFLEFPLNIVSFNGIGQAIFSLGKK